MSPNPLQDSLQSTVFFLVAAAFASIYVTQPVQPVLCVEFGITASPLTLWFSKPAVVAVSACLLLVPLVVGLYEDRGSGGPLLEPKNQPGRRIT